MNEKYKGKHGKIHGILYDLIYHLFSQLILNVTDKIKTIEYIWILSSYRICGYNALIYTTIKITLSPDTLID